MCLPSRPCLGRDSFCIKASNLTYTYAACLPVASLNPPFPTKQTIPLLQTPPETRNPTPTCPPSPPKIHRSSHVRALGPCPQRHRENKHPPGPRQAGL